MLDFIMVPAIFGICVLGIYKLFELFARRRERIMLIEKLGNIPVDNLSLPTFNQPKFSYGALKIGCLLVGMGLGLLIGYLICALTIPEYVNNAGNWGHRNISGLIYGGSIFIFGGIGLLIAFITELKLEKNKK